MSDKIDLQTLLDQLKDIDHFIDHLQSMTLEEVGRSYVEMQKSIRNHIYKLIEQCQEETTKEMEPLSVQELAF